MKLAIILFLFLSVGCEEDHAPDPSTRPPYSFISGLVDAFCISCHDGETEMEFNAENFISSGAEKRIADGSMPPPPLKLSDEDKTSFLDWFGK